MNQLEYVRRHILKLTQAELAAIANTTQATVSRWESGVSEPTLSELDHIRCEAISRGLLWNDSVFFEPVPSLQGQLS